LDYKTEVMKISTW